jgi:DNA-binding transcriptional ArsR family regulator
MTVGALAGKLDIRQAHLSQHLSILRIRGVVVTRKDGVNISYNIANPKIVRACSLIKEVLIEHLQRERASLLDSLTLVR